MLKSGEPSLALSVGRTTTTSRQVAGFGCIKAKGVGVIHSIIPPFFISVYTIDGCDSLSIVNQLVLYLTPKLNTDFKYRKKRIFQAR
jgi:hypothetical protein